VKYSKRKPSQDRICIICGSRFTVAAHLARKKPALCCSTECVLKSRRKPVTSVRCAQCGNKITLSPWQVKRSATFGHFCNSRCYGKWRTDNLAGDNSPNWNGGHTLDYGGSNWKSQRRKARERDNHTCQKCGLTKQPHGYKMDVHHKVPYDMFDDPKMANALNNLVTVCRPCHVKLHGKGRFTWEKIS
jgi:5-methylcytosine-specific restriction endonuclease McrA